MFEVGHSAVLSSERSLGGFSHGFLLAWSVGVGDEIGGDERKKDKSKSWISRKDMTTNDEMTFEVHSEILSHTRVRVKVRACTRIMCACCPSGEVFCVQFWRTGGCL